MKRGVIWLAFACLVVISLILASCSKTTSITTSTQVSTPTISSTQIQTSTTVTTTTNKPATTTVTTTSTSVSGNWWDSLGTPQYGGTIVLRSDKDFTNFDPYGNDSLPDIMEGYMERLFSDNWTVDPAIFDYSLGFRPNDYVAGLLAKSWEFSDPNTFVVHLRQGIHWQNIAPVNGREFTADDVVYHYDRLYGIGDGFTKVASYHTGDTAYAMLKSVTASDKYTVAFSSTTPNPEYVLEILQAAPGAFWSIEAPEAVKLWGDLSDWHHAIGTGAFILTDFVSNSSATLTKNPDYWGFDERYPKNKLPYADSIKVLIIPDISTALAGLRTGKIDVLDKNSVQNAQSMKKTNPEILQIGVVLSQAYTVDPRNDVAPFKDIRVRKAMQMAIDLPTIAKSYYSGTADPWPSALTSNYLKGWGFSYDQWPQDLKDEYAYNPTAAKKLLSDAGYPNGFKTNIVADITGDVDLLQVVKSYFASVGIDMTIQTMDTTSWINYVQTGRKQDQLAQKSVGNLGLTFEPIKQLNRFKTTDSTNWEMVNDPVFNDFYNKALAATTVNAFKQVITDANKYVVQQHFTISLLQPTLFGLYQPWLKGYRGQDRSISGGSGPNMLFYYGPRFSIDQNLKKTIGH